MFIGIRGIFSRKKDKPLRIFIGYSEISSFCFSLSSSLQALGQKAHFCDLLYNKYYPVGKLTIIERALRKILNTPKKNNRVVRFIQRHKKRILLRLLFDQMKLNYDAFIFIGTYSPFALDERKLLRSERKRIISVFLGSDSRPIYLNAVYLDKYGTDYTGFAKAIKNQFETIKNIENGSDIVVCHALSAHFLSRSFIRFLALGFPKVIDKNLIKEYGEKINTLSDLVPSKEKPFRILHAPSQPKYKGSGKISQIVMEMKAEGYFFELEIITGRPNKDVIHAIQNCDLVIDELYSDTPLAGFALEAGQLAKLPIVGSYAKELDFFGDYLPPSMFIHPDKLKETLQNLYLKKSIVYERGRVLKEYINKEWDPLTVAARYLNLINGSAELKWYSSPYEIRYVHGWGIEEKDLLRKLKALIEHVGIESLCLGGKPELEKSILEFIGVSTESTA